MVKEQSPQNVNWGEYFYQIREQCPWSYAAYKAGLIDIVPYQGIKLPLDKYQARMYLVNASESIVVALAEAFDYEDTVYEWLYSYPGYGEYATPVSVLIQQNRAQLNDIRKRL